MKEFVVSRLVKSEDLNHHGTLFAGRTAEWFVEAAFIAAASSVGNPENIVCMNVHGLLFKTPVSKGDIITFKSKIVRLGTTSITVHTSIYPETTEITPVNGFLTFIHVDESGKKIPHSLVIDETTNEEELKLREQAKKLF
ncbi:MAG TPA: acyl-CoA thioesterase [Clostridiales bacterium]|nr:acyl-CoA thioesterase [Clostridiales bacterium]